jgi:hypothetical protein
MEAILVTELRPILKDGNGRLRLRASAVTGVRAGKTRNHVLVKSLDIIDPQSKLTTACEIALHGSSAAGFAGAAQGQGRSLADKLRPFLADLQGRADRGPACWRDTGGNGLQGSMVYPFVAILVACRADETSNSGRCSGRLVQVCLEYLERESFRRPMTGETCNGYSARKAR